MGPTVNWNSQLVLFPQAPATFIPQQPSLEALSVATPQLSATPQFITVKLVLNIS